MNKMMINRRLAQTAVSNSPFASEMTQLPKLRVTMFGTLQVLRDSHVVTESDWHTRQARQLLKILVTERPRPVSTDRLIEILWPDSTPHAAATTLRSAINSLRNVLEPDRPNRAPAQYILTQMPGYAFHLHANIWLDVDIFERKLNAAQQTTDAAQRYRLLEEAIALYQDDYLISDPYADWAENERERLRERYFAALLQLADLQARNGDHASAINACRHILARDEVRENAYQALMRYLAESGDSAGALLAYEKCRSILADELGADPSPLTQALHQRILNGEIPLQSPHILAETAAHSHSSELAGAHFDLDGKRPDKAQILSVVLPAQALLPALDTSFLEVFVGRQAAIDRFESLWDRVLRGEGALLVLEGEAGVGKTRLAYHLLRHAEESHATVISTACQALERQLPFSALADSLGRYLHRLPPSALHLLPAASLGQLVQIVPSLRDRLADLPVFDLSGSEAGLATANENRQRLIDSIVALLMTLAQLRPLLFFLDDLHWADADTLAVLGRLAQRVNDAPFLLLLAYRSDELAENEALGTLLRSIKRSQPQSSFLVSRLNHLEVREYIHQVLGQQQAARATIPDLDENQIANTLFETTQGNALFVSEALRDLCERQLTADDSPEGGFGPNSLQRWPGRPWDWLNLGQNRRVHEIIEERISRLPETAYGVLQVSAVIGRDFSLELIENAFTPDPLEGVEVLLQRNFLLERPDQRLEFSHQVVAQAAYDGMSNLQRRRWHRRVADALVKLQRDERNPSEVAFHYQQAGDSARPLYALYCVKAGEALLRTYGFRQAIEHFDQALAVLETLPETPPDLIRRSLQGRGLAYEGLFEPAGMTAAYRRLQHWASNQGERRLLLTTYSRLTSMLALFGQQRESHELLQELRSALSHTNKVPTPHSRVVDDLIERRRLIYTPNKTEIDEEWSVYLPPPPAIADPVADLLHVFEPVHAVLPLLDYGWTLLVQGQLGEATYCLEKVVDLANQTAQPSIASTAYHQLAVTSRILGDLEQSQALNEQSMAINRATPGVPAELASMWPRIASAFLSLEAGRIDEAERRLRRVLDFLEDRNSFRAYRNSANIGLGLVHLRRGESELARALLETALVDLPNLYPYTHVRALLGMAEIATQSGTKEAAVNYLRRALHFAGRRSLIEEYLAALRTIARLHIADVPWERLRASFLAYTESIGLKPAGEQLVQLT